ncbi:MAG: methyltransferase domain-containing protein [Clostridia bacterium]
METNYSKHAAYWDWDLYDNSKDIEFWFTMSEKYGKNILSPMCAIGKSAAYLAYKGLNVTALDYTEEMILEGKKRFGNIEYLNFVQEDIRYFKLCRQYDFCFIDGSDIHLLPSIEDVKLALLNINGHLRSGGGLGVELVYPFKESHFAHMKRFDPRVPRNDCITWKEGDSYYNAVTKKQVIHQYLFIKKDEEIDCIEHFVNLQYYDREEIFDTFQVCGFKIVGQYCDRMFNKGDKQNENCFIELEKI